MLNNKKFWIAGALSLLLSGTTLAATMEEVTAAVKEEKFERAARLLTEIANTGNAEAQFLLALMFENGRGVTQNDREAFQWYKKAADQGLAAAQNNLAHLYRQGKGVKQDLKEAVRWYRRAAEAGHDIAQYNLGVRYMKGEGIEQNLKEGANWYRKSAEAGNLHGQFSLAYSYAAGEGVEKSMPDAYAWAKAASTKRFPRAQQFVGFLASQMTPEEVEAGEKLFLELKTRMNLPDAPPPAGPLGTVDPLGVENQTDAAH